QPSLLGADVGDVRHPCAIGRSHVELLLQEVLGHQAGAPASIAWPALVTRLRAQTVLAHEPRHTVPATVLTQIPQIMGNLAITINMAAILPALTDEPHEPSILKRTSAVRRTAPGVVATGVNPEHRTHASYRENGDMIANEGVPHWDCFAKYAAAFFKMSRSSVTRRSSAFRRRTSWACSPVSRRTPSSPAYCLRH